MNKYYDKETSLMFSLVWMIIFSTSVVILLIDRLWMVGRGQSIYKWRSRLGWELEIRLINNKKKMSRMMENKLWTHCTNLMV